MKAKKRMESNLFDEMDFCCAMERNSLSGTPSGNTSARQAHSSHLCFVGPHCAIKNKERDEMEEVGGASAVHSTKSNKSQTNQIKNLMVFDC